MSRLTLRRVAFLVGYGVGGTILGGLLAASIMVMGAGAFWLFIFGDDAWPGWAEAALVGVAYVVALVVLGAALREGWRRGAAPRR